MPSHHEAPKHVHHGQPSRVTAQFKQLDAGS